MKRLAALLPLLMLAAAALALLHISLQPGGEPSPTQAEATAQIPIYIAHQATWVRFDQNDVPQLRAQAERIDYFEDRSMKLSEVKLDRLGSKNGYWHVSAPEGQVPAGESRMRLQPQVAANGEAPKALPVTIAASEVWVDWGRQRLYSDHPVDARAPGRAAKAQTWSSDFGGQQVQLSGQVEMQYDVPPR